MEIEDVFSAGGILAQHLEGYESRPTQVQLAKAIASSLASRHHLICEGPCGVGKSMSYLIPAIFQSIQVDSETNSHQRTVVATANIGLQEQLVKKDLPFLQSILPVEFSYALMKGRNNYLCRASLDRNKEETQYDLGFGAERDQDAEVAKWAERTTTGDKSELPFEPLPRLWGTYSVTADECLRGGCKYNQSGCFANMARERISLAHIVVCNYHLLFAHVGVKRETGKDLILPEFDYLICDEGHKTADIARSFFGWSHSEYSINSLISFFMNMVKKCERDNEVEARDKGNWDSAMANATRANEEIWGQASKFHGDAAGPKRIRQKRAILSVGLSDALRELGDQFKALKGFDWTEEDEARLDNAKGRSRKIADELDELMELTDQNAVFFTERTGKRQALRLTKRQIEVAADLWNYLFSQTKSSIVTSATLGVGGNCGYVRREMGLREAKELIVDSPFDFRKQAMLVLSERAPDPQKDGHPEAVCKVIDYVVEQIEGKTLCLFTSYKSLRIVQQYFEENDPGVTVFVQGDMPRETLLRKFREDENSILLGTDSFWAGVDAPGPTLSCVIIDKLPFKAPTDPVWQELTERDENWFFNLAIPAASIQLKQGVGRLIRKKTDRGIVIILDCRLMTKGYGGIFVRSLPRMTIARTLKGGSLRKFLGMSEKQ